MIPEGLNSREMADILETSLPRFDKIGFIHAIYKFSIMAFFYIAFQVCAYYFRKILEIRWRRWLTKYYLDTWFKKKSYYKTRFVNQISDNPDQRISEDINGFITLSLDLTLGFMNATVTLISFAFILWTISGVLEFNFLKHHFIIPGYMFFAAVIYAKAVPALSQPLQVVAVEVEERKVEAVVADFSFQQRISASTLEA